MVLIALILAGVLLYLTLRGLDWTAFFRSFRQVELLYLIPIVLWTSLVYLTRSARWRILLKGEQPLRLLTVHWANMAGYLGNNLLPARAGEFIRSVYLSRTAGISASFILATCLVERMVDVVALVILGAVSLALLGLVSEEIGWGLVFVAVIGVAGLFPLIFLPRIGDRFIKIIYDLSALKEQQKARLAGWVAKFLVGLESLSSGGKIVPFGLWTALIWFMEAVGTSLLALAFHQSLPLFDALVLLAGLGLSSVLPSTPGSVGIYQFVAVSILVPLGFQREAALAYILAAQGITYVTVILWGGVALWQSSRQV
jgi:uncharacterized protein (TIRG00374 family)